MHVTDVRRDGVTVTPKAGGAAQEYAARTVLWTAGVEAVPFARRLARYSVQRRTTRAGSRVADLTVPGHPEIFVIGDLAGRDNLPGVAENAMQGGLHAAACVRHDREGRPRNRIATAISARPLTSAADMPCCRRARSSSPGSRVAGLGARPHRIPHRRAEQLQHPRHLADRDRPRPTHGPNIHARQSRRPPTSPTPG